LKSGNRNNNIISPKKLTLQLTAITLVVLLCATARSAKRVLSVRPSVLPGVKSQYQNKPK